MYFSQYFGFPNFLLVLESPDFKISKSFRHFCVTCATRLFGDFEKRNFKKREKFHDIYGLTIVCVKFNNWKLTTSLFLFFYEDSTILCW